MDIKFVSDIMLVIIIVIWTGMIMMMQIIAFSTRSKVPFEMLGKFLNLFVHILLLCAMWLNVIRPGTTMGWILIIFGALFLIPWMFISRYQNRYITRQISILEKKMTTTLEEYKNNGKGRPRGPSGKYTIEGKPVMEEEYSKWLTEQKKINREKAKQGLRFSVKEKLLSLNLEEIKELEQDIKDAKARRIKELNQKRVCSKCHKIKRRSFFLIEAGKQMDICKSCFERWGKI